MTSAKSADEQEAASVVSAPATPQAPKPNVVKARRKSTAAKPSTPMNKSDPDGDAAPKTAPARPRAATAKHQPTLLTDFLLGRPSPARVAADREAARKRRASLDVVKQEMRQAAVRKVQQPGGISERVKKWQKANAAAMVGEDPFAAPSEPSEVHIQVDDKSVTEEDRVRIKLRQKKKPPPAVIVVEKAKGVDEEEKENEDAAKSASPPKKRVVSDTNWMNKNAHKVRKSKSPPRSRSPKGNKNDSGGLPLPKNFLQRPTATPNVANRVREWATKVEIPDDNSSRLSTRSARTARSGDDGIRVTPMPSQAAESLAPTETTQSSKSSTRSASAHVIRDSASSTSTPKKKIIDDDGIRVTPMKTKLSPDDGIRVTPMKKNNLVNDGIRIFGSKPDTPSDSNRTPRASDKRPAGHTSRSRARSPSEKSDVIEVIEASDSDETSTPVRDDLKKQSDTRRNAPQQKRRAAATDITGTSGTATTFTESTGLTESTEQQTEVTGTTASEGASDDESWSSGSGVESERVPPTVLPGNLAEIPVGYSAFSELDLPTGPKKRPNAKRQSSFKGATHVLKKAFEGSKKIIQEKVDPPKPVVNQPPSIENWLSGTVDPFMEANTSKATDDQTEITETDITETDITETDITETDISGTDYTEPGSPETNRVKSPSTNNKHGSASNRSASSGGSNETEKTPKVSKSRPRSGELSKGNDRSREELMNAASPGLKRRAATRNSSSVKNGPPKKGFADRIRDAFRGESAAHAPPPFEYPSCSTVISYGDETEFTDATYSTNRRSSGSRSPTTITASDDRSYITDESSYISKESSYVSKSSVDQAKRKPPTNGRYELSTILSEHDTMTELESEISSMLSDTTFTRTNTRVSRQKSHRSRNGSLKRRLTKHSDLVSVLSLPDEGPAPSRNQSLRSHRSVRRTHSRKHGRTVDTLLHDFARDENLYQRELKTLVDGVLPVLLTQVVKNDRDDKGPLLSSKGKGEPLSKSVVNMGIALEKLRNAHRRCPLGNVQLLPQWLESTHTIYNNYLDVWRLSYEGVIVNLKVNAFDDNDSLINAMPQNEDGDVINQDGERIDVAHLLKRPLVRIKWITKFIQGYRKITDTEDYESLATRWEVLQDKARRRHKEEQARVIDEDAINTDTTRVRDLRTLSALDYVRIDKFRQVYAKDSFSMELRHSMGQRLDCQVELVFRDNQLFKSDPGDLLIRETGREGRNWLVFAPVLGGRFSARLGNNNNELVVMIRGHDDEWSELLILTADDEDQVLDWLDMLGTSPVPPEVPNGEFTEAQSRSLIAESNVGDVPMGERRKRGSLVQSQSQHFPPQSPERKAKTPDRYHMRNVSSPLASYQTAPPQSDQYEENYEHEPLRRSHSRLRHSLPTNTLPEDDQERSERSRPLSESMRPDPATFVITEPDHEPPVETPPPPPAHRIISTKKKPQHLAPPVDEGRLRRQRSSPLKHEYMPSDTSSADQSDYTSSSGSETETEGEDEGDSDSYESSDDELEAVDMPETTPAISIRQQAEDHHPYDDHANPQVSGSQTTFRQPAESSRPQPQYSFHSKAAISYWDNKHGAWKDLWPDSCDVITTPGLIEAYPVSPEGAHYGGDSPLIALDLTPLVMLRNSTVLDLEIRSPVLNYARLFAKMNKVDTSFFRFRTASFQDSEQLYIAVHRARMDNAKYKALEEETRVRAFGQNQYTQPDNDATSSRRRSWFGRKNSYRASARAPSQSQGSASQPSSAVSASSFLKRLMGGNSHAFDIGMSSIDKQSRPGTGNPSLYGSSSSSTPPRSPSISAANSGPARASLTTNNLKIRLHMLVSASKWEDHGNCLLEVMRPDQGTRQNLRTYQGMEKRIIIRTYPKKGMEHSVVVLDVVLGSRCFTRLGSRGILLNVWEEVKDETGAAGMAPKDGGSGGQVNKWCFQCASVTEASWIFGLVTQEVMIG